MKARSQYEQVPPDEAADIAEVTAHILELQRRFADREGLPLQRGTHAKGVCARAVFEVFDLGETLDDPALARRLARGPFAEPGIYPAVTRFANAESRVQSDMKKDVRAFSFSAMFGGEGDDEGRVDFSMNNSPAFPINDVHDFAVLMRVLAAPSAWKALGVLARLSFRERWHFLKTAVRGGRQKKHNARVAYQVQRYWSTVPFALGDEVIKYSAIPRRHNRAAPLVPGPSMLRDELLRHLVEDSPPAAFDFAVQILDADRMTYKGRTRDPSFWVENAAVEWHEDQAPFHVVGRLSLLPAGQLPAHECSAMYMDVHEHTTDGFVPIGGINRGRWKPEKQSRIHRFDEAAEDGAVAGGGRPRGGLAGAGGAAAGGGLVAIPVVGAVVRAARRAARVSLGRLARGGAVAVLVGLGLVFLLSLATSWYLTSGRAMLPDEAPDAVVYADQGWGPGLEAPGRQTYYYTPQGAGLRGMRYEWFVHLELPLSRDRLADPDLMRRYGFIVDPATPANPDQLPVGFTKHYDEGLNENVLSITCAACHTGELHVTRGDVITAYRVDGGQANHAFTDASFGNFVPTMLSSLIATVTNPVKFNRFARRVLGETYPEGKGTLRSEMLEVVGTFARIGWNERSLYPTEEGYGRTDALARIANTVYGENLNLHNLNVGNAPVSYPPVWNIWKFDWVQYNASVSQPMARNFGEALGVGATYALVDRYGRPLPPADRFGSSVIVENLNTIEHTLRRLDPPAWPAELFGAIDTALADQGRRLFDQHCVGCHGPFEADAALKARNAPDKGPDDPEWIVHVVCTDDVGTDPHAAQNFARARVDISRTGLTAGDLRTVAQKNLSIWVARNRAYLRGEIGEAESGLERARGAARDSVARHLAALRARLDRVPADSAQALAGLDPESLPVGLALSYVGTMMRELAYDRGGYTAAERDSLDGFGIADMPQIVAGYKPRPLAGIWATPPYLHNGSVPTIYDLLSPVDERPKTFRVGSREFDPEKVGLAEPDGGNWFELDTSLPGNWNTGHEFNDGYTEWTPDSGPAHGLIGPKLTHDERMAIIEHLKVRDDDAEARPASYHPTPDCPVTPGR